MNTELLVDETTIELEGIQREITILHITDMHLTEIDERERKEVIAAAAQRQRHFNRNRTRSLFTAMVELSNRLGVDCTVFTGDIIDFPSQRNLELMKEQYDLLNSPYMYTLGNHDWLFMNAPVDDETRESFYPKFQPFTDGNPAYQAKVIGGIRLITFDNSNYQISEDQLTFVKDQVQTGMPCLLFMHIPLYIPALAPRVEQVWGSPILLAAQGWDPNKRRQWNVRDDDQSTTQFYEWLTSDDSRNIKAIFCGHVHFARTDSFGSGRCQSITRPGFEGGCRKIRIVPKETGL